MLGPVAQFDRAWRGFAVDRLGQHCHRPDGPGRGVKAQHPRLFDLGAQGGLDGGYFFAHIIGGLAPVDVQAEFDHHHRLPLVAARGQGADAGDGVDAFLNLARDLTLHNLGCGAGVVGNHHHRWEIDVGELVDLQALQGKQAQHHQGQHDHGGKNRVFKANAREPHGLLAQWQFDARARPLAAQRAREDDSPLWQALDADHGLVCLLAAGAEFYRLVYHRAVLDQ